ALSAVLQGQQSHCSFLTDPKLTELTLRWLRGEEPDWSRLWGNAHPHRLSGLPVRAFLGAVHLPPFSADEPMTSLDVNDGQKFCQFRISAS
ncbi:hypothetical protein KKI93_25525, partial [Xenorhabdus bovienii]|uniref:hypothetical protein n=1 Tax=Xenorhabdus bovienii TaxID=40576 RepID=UPI0023B299FA